MPCASDCTCPHIDKGDRRCADRFTLGGLEGAFEVCISGWNACAHYHRISTEESFQRRVDAGEPGAAQWYEHLRRSASSGAPTVQPVTVASRPVQDARVRQAV